MSRTVTKSHEGLCHAPAILGAALLLACSSTPATTTADVASSGSGSTSSFTSQGETQGESVTSVPTPTSTSGETGAGTMSTGILPMTTEPSGTSGVLDPPTCETKDDKCPVGFKCVPYYKDSDEITDKQGCFPLPSLPDGLGEPCESLLPNLLGADSCAKGLVCFGYICRHLCVGSNDLICPDSKEWCFDWFDNHTLQTCLPTCDPLASTCPNGESCNTLYPVYVCGSHPGDLPAFAPCSSDLDCNPGLTCKNGAVAVECAQTPCCTSLCKIGEAGNCPGVGQVCKPMYDGVPPLPMYDTLGFCSLP